MFNTVSQRPIFKQRLQADCVVLGAIINELADGTSSFHE